MNGAAGAVTATVRRLQSKCGTSGWVASVRIPFAAVPEQAGEPPASPASHFRFNAFYWAPPTGEWRSGCLMFHHFVDDGRMGLRRVAALQKPPRPTECGRLLSR